MNELIEVKKNALLEVIERVATNKDVDVSKMQALIDMQIQVMEKEAEMAFNKAMVSLRKELPAIVKEKENKQTRSKYADLEAIKKAIDPLLSKYGFFDTYDDDFPEDGVIVTTCILTHESGYCRKNKVRFKRDNVGIAGSKNKTDVHGDASAMTYGQRLSLCRALGIRIAEDDDGNKAQGTITQEHLIRLNELIAETNTNENQFLALFGVDSLDELPIGEFKKAQALLIAKRGHENG